MKTMFNKLEKINKDTETEFQQILKDKFLYNSFYGGSATYNPYRISADVVSSENDTPESISTIEKMKEIATKMIKDINLYNIPKKEKYIPKDEKIIYKYNQGTYGSGREGPKLSHFIFDELKQSGFEPIQQPSRKFSRIKDDADIEKETFFDNIARMKEESEMEDENVPGCNKYVRSIDYIKTTYDKPIEW